MQQLERSNQITRILSTINSGDHPELSTELASYIAKLESPQGERPAQITSILRSIRSQYPADMGISLDAYITDLEVKHLGQDTNNCQFQMWDSNNPPVWSHEHAVERDHQRRQRAQNKLEHNYQ